VFQYFSACISIASAGLREANSIPFLEIWTAGLLDAGLLDAGLLDAGLLECMHTVLEPGRDLCAFLLCSSTAARGKVPKISFSAYYSCLHFYCFLLTILFSFSITFPLCIAFPYAFPMIVKPPSHIRMIKNLNPLQQPKK